MNCSWQFLAMEQQKFDRFRYETLVTLSAAKATLANCINQINVDRALLADLCRKHGNTILSRWRKKSQSKREAQLLLADPTIEKEPWIRLRVEGEKDLWQEVRKCRRSLLLPYWSTSIMKVNPSVFLGLLHHRFNHSPEEWAPFDSYQMRQGWAL
jgi:hypothetical protein